MIRAQKVEENKIVGKCELCGAHRRELRVLVIDDFFGWACEECRQQLRDSVIGIYCRRGENGTGGIKAEKMRAGKLTQKESEHRNKRIRAYKQHRQKLRKRRTEKGYDYRRSVRETRSGE